MPIYEYQCRECEHVLDALQKIGEAPLSSCPACGEDALKRLLSAPRFRLKGGGWYETDFKTSGKRNLAGDGASDDGGSKAPKSKDASKDPSEKGSKASDGGASKKAAKTSASSSAD